MRARPHSAEETQFLADHVAGRRRPASATPDLQAAPAVLLAGFEPQDESPIVFLRLRRAARAGRLAVFSLAALASPGLSQMSGSCCRPCPARGGALKQLADAGRTEPQHGRRGGQRPAPAPGR